MLALSLASWAIEAHALPLDPGDFASLGTLAPAGPITIDTDVPEITGAVSFSGVLDGEVAVFTFDTVQLDDLVTVVGTRPLALLSQGTLGLGAAGSIDAAAREWRGGSGGFDGGLVLPSEAPCAGPCPSAQGKGPGGGVMYVPRQGTGGGGNGGAGGTSGECLIDPTNPLCASPYRPNQTSLGGRALGDPIHRLVGGSGGARSGGIWKNAYYGGPGYGDVLCFDGAGSTYCWGGGGGGALELGAAGPITLEGQIDVRGADHGSPSPSYYNAAAHSGGAGGTVLVHGNGGTSTATILAFGGAGGEGRYHGGGGGGGGGGRVTLSGLDTVGGTIDVSGGAGGSDVGVAPAPGEDGQDGVVVIDGDADYLDDGEEVAVYGTDPLVRDTDRGGVRDGLEVFHGRDPLWGGDDMGAPVLTLVSGSGYGLYRFEASFMRAGPPVHLVLGDGLGVDTLVPGCTPETPIPVGAVPHPHASVVASGGTATLRHSIPPGWVGTIYAAAVQPASCRVTNVLALTVCADAGGDSDGDLLCDPVENGTGTDPLDADTDDDGLQDGLEDTDGDGVVDSGETDPRLPDTDGDGYCDDDRVDNDGDGIDPADPCAYGGFTQLALGAATHCALRTLGDIACWGYDQYGLLAPPPGQFVEISSGAFHACALDAAGTPVCWGDTSCDQLDVPAAGSYVGLDAGNYNTCAINASTLAVRCWGGCVGSPGRTPPLPGTYLQVSAGHEHACAVRTDQTLACWGRDDYGQASPPAGSYASVSAGAYHSCAIDLAGSVSCWGVQDQTGFDYGQVTETPTSGAWAEVDATDFTTCALDTAGEVTCWGRDTSGTSSPPPGPFTQVDASTSYGVENACALDAAGAITCWGDDTYGQSQPPL